MPLIPLVQRRASPLATAVACAVLIACSWPSATLAGYAADEAELRQDGRAVARLVAARDGAALFARFSPALAEALPREQLDALLAEVHGTAAVGARVGDSALPLGPAGRGYTADHRWGDRVLAIELVLAPGGAVGSLRLSERAELPPDPAAGRRPVELRLPVEGTWWTYWGGPDERRNYHVVAPDQRHALDLVQWRRGGTGRGAGERNRDYHAWNRRVLAPASGVVVERRDGIRDNRPLVEGTDEQEPAGNHVVLAIGHGRFALLGHLRRGSVRVRAGQRVRAGHPLGRVGNSGSSSEPHLHLHVQDRPGLGTGIGLPVTFRRVLLDGEPRRRAAPEQGQFVARAPARPRPRP